MSAEAELSATSPFSSNTTQVPIAQLSPDASHTDEYYLEANVALIWPYSSSTKRLGLLLAEKDIRLRKSKGQVKVIFHGDCAQEVARTHVGIGDSVKLGLRHATWTRTGEEISTPGRKLDWDIDIDKHVLLEVARGKDRTTTVNFTVASPPPVVGKNSIAEIAGPTTNGFVDIPRTRLPDFLFFPAHRSSRVSSDSSVNAGLDPFADDDGHIFGKGRKRTKFAKHSGSWRLLDVDDQPSTEHAGSAPSTPLQRQASKEFVARQPETIRGRKDEDEVEQNEARVEGSRDLEAPVQTAPPLPVEEQPTFLRAGEEADKPTYQDFLSSNMGPPPLPSPTTPTRSQLHSGPHIDSTQTLEMAETPVLRPLLSPGLPLVSPLIERFRATTGYFPAVSNAQPVLDAASELSRQTQGRQDPHISTLQATTGDPNVVEGDEGESGSGLHFRQPAPSFSEDVAPLVEQVPEASIGNDKSDMLPVPVSQQTVASGFNNTGSRANIMGDVDLDVLQQEIDESSQHYHDNSPAVQSEEEDMYGPPVSVRKKAVTAIMTDDMKNPLGKVLEALSPVQSQPQPLTNSVVPSKAVEEDEVMTELSEQSSEDVEAAEAINVRAGLEGEKGNSDGIPDKNEGEDYNADSVGEGAFLTDPRQLSTGAGFETIPPPESIFGAPDNRYLLSSPPPVPIVEEIVQDPTSSFNEVSTGFFGMRTIARSDGVDESYEDENQRTHLRAGTKLPVKSVDLQVVSASSDASAEEHSLAADSERRLSFEAPDLNHLIEESSEVLMVTQNNDRDFSELIDEHINQELEDDTTELSGAVYSMQQHPRSANQIYTSHNMITPEATQQYESPVNAASSTVVGPQTQLPLTPLTQNTNDRARNTSPRDTYSPGPEREEVEPTLPQIAPENTSPNRKFSQRLTRKSFMPARISTEYFTPRRSKRVAQSSPTSVNNARVLDELLTSPTRPKRILRSSSPSIIQYNKSSSALAPDLAPGTSTPLSYYPHLSTLHEHFNLQVDVIAVCSTKSSDISKAKSGPKDHFTTLLLADASFAEHNKIVRAQIFRPRKNALPVVKRGDVVLLRNMRVQTQQHDVLLVSTESSAWAVFKQLSGQIADVTVNGPPVEYDDYERTEADRLLTWWTDEGSAKYPDTAISTDPDRDSRETRSTSPMVTRSQKRRTVTPGDHEKSREEYGDSEEEEGGHATSVRGNSNPPDALGAAPPHEKNNTDNMSAGEPSASTVPTKRRTHRRTNSKRSDSVIHELRDGFTWVDSDGRQRSPSTIHQLRDGSTYVDE